MFPQSLYPAPLYPKSLFPGAMGASAPAEYADTDADAVTFAAVAPDPTIAGTSAAGASPVGRPMTTGGAMLPISVMPGETSTPSLQCWTDDGQKAVYGPGDALRGEIWQQGISAPISTPAVLWYTARNTQTGYDQGQILPQFTSSVTTALQPTCAYRFYAYRTLAGGGEERIAKAQLVIDTAAF